MSVIAQDVFILAMDLMDEITQDGTYAGYPDDYKKKSWSILTVLQSQLLPANVAPLAITSESTPFQIDDRSATAILPYGLAAHLLITTDMNRASFFNNTFDELKRKRPTQIQPIVDALGINRKTTAPSTDVPIDGGSFLDPNSGKYDGGTW